MSERQEEPRRFAASKRAIVQAKQNGNQDLVDELLNMVEANVDMLISAMPEEPPRFLLRMLGQPRLGGSDTKGEE